MEKEVILNFGISSYVEHAPNVEVVETIMKVPIDGSLKPVSELEELVSNKPLKKYEDTKPSGNLHFDLGCIAGYCYELILDWIAEREEWIGIVKHEWTESSAWGADHSFSGPYELDESYSKLILDRFYCTEKSDLTNILKMSPNELKDFSLKKNIERLNFKEVVPPVEGYEGSYEDNRKYGDRETGFKERVKAAENLGKLKEEEAISYLKKALYDSGDLDGHNMARVAWYHIGGQEVQKAALDALVEIGGKEAHEVLLDKLEASIKITKGYSSDSNNFYDLEYIATAVGKVKRGIREIRINFSD